VTSTVVNVTFDCADPYGLAGFWSAVVGLPIDPDAKPGDDEVQVVPPKGQSGFLFIRVPEGKTAKNRMHLDLTQDSTRDAEVARLLELGATLVQDHRKADGTGWAYMADPEGNEFCVELNQGERDALAQ
jgi:predicted enzyme related to lactoylglutathione lyase